jgi:hypothetical protein
LDGFDDNLDGLTLTDADLNDPSLLAELRALSGEPVSPIKRAQQSPSLPKVDVEPSIPLHQDVEALVSSIPLHDDEDVHVELTEADMNDPHLLVLLLNETVRLN